MTVLTRDGATVVTAARVGACPPDSVAELYSAFGGEYVDSLVRRNPRSRDESLSAARLLLETLRYCREEPTAVARGEFGKPFAPGAGYDFSLSHDGGLAVCALSFAGPVGIDVCPVTRAAGKDIPAFAARFLCPGEERLLAAAGPAERGRLFAKIWADREAASKMNGGRLALTFGRDCSGFGSFFRLSVASAAGECRISVCRTVN
ncbi:MAG: 4'-phosphopantetheinyl transferase superfamily protein [Clostridia bacterium]|nr:4'-phosphopantetheinyl transferase superfamily protein [Clostridia bacterium]